jgi:glycerol transport system ATP-binding protein
MSLELRRVTKRVGAETHIHETNLALAPEGFNVLLGATNAGKTTLIKLMAGLEQPTTGEIWFRGQNVTGVIPRRRNVSLVHQFFINYPNMNVFDNIASPLRVAKLPRAEIQRRVGEAAELLHLTPMLKRRPQELSGGQQQRTALARAIVKDSDLVLLDEPLANLDYKLREELRDQLPQLFAGRGAVVVYATSEPSEALMLGGHTATIYQGRVTQFGTTQDCYRATDDLTTARVFSDPPMNAAPVEKRGGEIVLLDQVRWPAAGQAAGIPDGTYTLGLRPHFVTPSRSDAGQVPLQGVVRITELSGSESVAHFAVGERTWVAQSNGVHPYRVGESHDFFLDVRHGLYFTGDGRRVA